jgi:hypothetical protein
MTVRAAPALAHPLSIEQLVALTDASTTGRGDVV